MTKLRALAEKTIKEAEAQLRATEQQMANLARQRDTLMAVMAKWQEALDEPVVVPRARPVKKIQAKPR